MSLANAFLLFQPALLVTCAVVWIILSSPTRRKRELNRRLLMERYPDASQQSVILPLQSSFQGGKQREIDDYIKQMRQRGWEFLDMGAVSPFVSLRHWGGAVRLDFLDAVSQGPMQVSNVGN